MIGWWRENAFHGSQTNTAVLQLCLGFPGFFTEAGEIAQWLSTVEAAAAPGVVQPGFDHLSSEISPLE